MNELDFKIALLKRYKESIKFLEDAKEKMTNKIDKIEDFEK